MRNRLLCELDASFAVSLDYVASDIWVALSALDDQSVVAARCNDVLPDLGRTVLGTTRTSDLDAVGVAPFDFIFDQMRLVVIDLYANLIQVERVANDNCLDI